MKKALVYLLAIVVYLSLCVAVLGGFLFGVLHLKVEIFDAVTIVWLSLFAVWTACLFPAFLYVIEMYPIWIKRLPFGVSVVGGMLLAIPCIIVQFIGAPVFAVLFCIRVAKGKSKYLAQYGISKLDKR